MGLLGTNTVKCFIIWPVLGIIIFNACLAFENPSHHVGSRRSDMVQLSHVKKAANNNKQRSAPKPKQEEDPQDDDDEDEDEDDDADIDTQPGKPKPRCHFGGMTIPMTGGGTDYTVGGTDYGGDYYYEYVGEGRRKRKKKRKQRKRRKQTNRGNSKTLSRHFFGHHHSFSSLPSDKF